MDKYKLRFVPLGGMIDVTKNMYVYELYQDDMLKDILIVDCGIGFPKEKELGVDFVIPDITYLNGIDPTSPQGLRRSSKIRGIILTHGHEDHTSALPFHYHDLGTPQVFTSRLTATFVRNRFKEFGIPVNINEVKYSQEYKFGDFQVDFIPITHSIPDTNHLLIKTPVGNIYHGADFKIDLTPPYGNPPDFYKLAKAGKDGVLCLLSDCLGAEREGFTLSENIVGQTFEDEMRKTKGKFIMTTFSSNISRIRQCVEAAKKFNRKILFMGRSMKENTRLAKEINYLPIPENLQAKEQDVKKMPSNKLCLIVAGSQGQYDSALSKLATDQNPNIKIKPGDKVVFSSDPIPGNEAEVYALIEELSGKGAEVVYSDVQEALHASGHGNRGDLKLLMSFTKPKYLIPIGGTIRHQRQYQKLAMDLGYQKEDTFLLNDGETVWFSKNQAQKGDVIDIKNIYVDAYGVGDVGNLVLRDRKSLSSEGIVVAILVLDKQGQLVTRPDVISRGFVFIEREKELFEKAKSELERILKPKAGKITDIYDDFFNLKKQAIKSLEEYFYKERGRRPLIVVDIIQV